jgi:predicted transcriptional regulator
MTSATQQPTNMHLQSENVAESATMQSSNLDAVPQRVREIAMLRGLGYSFRQIADQLHVTPQAVSLMLSRHRRSLKSLRGAVELSHLSARAVNALGRHGIRTRAEAKQRKIIDLLAGERNCGRKTLSEIEQWLSDDAASESRSVGRV